MDESGFHGWTGERFYVYHVMQCDGVSIQHAESLELSKVANQSTPIFRNDTSFVDAMKALASYAGTIEFKYGVKYIDTKAKGIVDDTQSLDYLRTWSLGMYNQYVSSTKLIKNKKALELLDTLSR